MSAPRKIHTIQLVKIQPEERLAATSELNPAPSLVTGGCEAMGNGMLDRNASECIEPEIHLVSEVDVFHMTEGSTPIIVNSNLQSWNIAESSGILRGDASPAGSEAVVRYQTDTMGTREAHGVLLAGVCGVKPMNGETLQMAPCESDQFIVLWKQGNACGGEGLAGVRCDDGGPFATHRGGQGMLTKPSFITLKCRGSTSEEPDEGKPHVWFCEGAHSNLGAITPVGGAL